MQLDGQFANERFTGECDFPEVLDLVQLCDDCGHTHEYHGPKGCQGERSTEIDGIEIDGPCGCSYFNYQEE